MTDFTHWLVKSEPYDFSIDDLRASAEQTTHWDGVRNYQARNFMRDGMKLGHRVLYYHSNCKPPSVVGVAEVVRESYPDFTSWDPDDKHFDPKSSEEKPRWFMVDIKFVEKFAAELPLQELKDCDALQGMELTRRGSRLSVQPVGEAHFEQVLAMGRDKGPPITD